MTKQIGFIVNPIAGMGGRVGLKGTDSVLKEAVMLGAKPVAPQKAEEMLREFCAISTSHSDIHWITCGGDMGDNELESVGIKKRM
jgi:predicted polyphosphate/ATP-dependent NAD kinase